ncbi:hypothetical protein VTL71DRAFT_15107 [Oculimacula yallundae]|uniref:Ankyrin repeat protein n=1 Tax=Oculimacula yallundae TaxID=86028 RepID=A0ABR4CFN6_9HELO
MVRSYFIGESETKSLTRVNKRLYELFIDFRYITDIHSGVNKALLWSVYHGYEGPLRRLIRLGVDLNQEIRVTEDVQDKVPSDLTYPIIRNSRDKRSTSALRMAAYNGDVVSLKLMLEAGAEIKVGIVGSNSSPLALTIEHNHTDAFHLLFDAMAEDLRHKHEGKLRMTPLHLASQHHRPNMIQAILKDGGDVTAKDRLGRAPLACSIHSGGHFMCELDAAKDLVIHHRLNPPTTPVMVETIKVLLDAGADPNGRASSFPRDIDLKNMKLTKPKHLTISELF